MTSSTAFSSLPLCQLTHVLRPLPYRAPSPLQHLSLVWSAPQQQSKTEDARPISVIISNIGIQSVARSRNERFSTYCVLLSILCICLTSCSRLKERTLAGCEEALKRKERKAATHRKAAERYRITHREQLAEKESIRRQRKVWITVVWFSLSRALTEPGDLRRSSGECRFEKYKDFLPLGSGCLVCSGKASELWCIRSQ